MPYIIPNAIDTTSGNRYSSLDQAEPDSIDFEILGNSNSGIISGCNVAQTPVQGTSVAVEAGVAVLNGIVYTVQANTYLVLPTPPSSLRFDLIVARLSGSTMSPVALQGLESPDNPAFPRSKSRMLSTTGVNQLTYFNPDTDIVLASVFRNGSNSILNADIVDKRKAIQTPIPYRGQFSPSATLGNVGDIYLQTGEMAAGQSGVYVKRDTTTWTQLATAQIDPGVPIGTVIMWVSSTPPNNAVWKECNGQFLDPSVYATLYSVIGTAYGTEAGTGRFALPDFRGAYLGGMPSTTSDFKTPAGNLTNSTVLTEANLPQHKHSINHGHTATQTQQGGDHTHIPDASGSEFAIKLPGNQPNYYVAPRDKDPYSGYADGYLIDLAVLAAAGPGMTISSTAKTARANPTTHDHTVTIPNSSNLESGFSGQPSPNPVDIRPRTMYVKYYIRYA